MCQAFIHALEHVLFPSNNRNALRTAYRMSLQDTIRVVLPSISNTINAFLPLICNLWVLFHAFVQPVLELEIDFQAKLYQAYPSVSCISVLRSILRRATAQVLYSRCLFGFSSSRFLSGLKSRPCCLEWS